jgi:hypothetical protein
MKDLIRFNRVLSRVLRAIRSEMICDFESLERGGKGKPNPMKRRMQEEKESINALLMEDTVEKANRSETDTRGTDAYLPLTTCFCNATDPSRFPLA